MSNETCACGAVCFLDLADNPYLAMIHSPSGCVVPVSLPTIPPLRGGSKVHVLPK